MDVKLLGGDKLLQKKIINIVCFVAALVSSMYLLMLGYYALPTADDWGWARQVSDLGSFGFVRIFYYGWQGRFSALLVDGTLCKWLGWNEHLFLFSCVELLLGYVAVYLLLRDLAKIPQSITLAFVSAIITNLGVMALPEIGTFYWLCTSNYIHEIWLTMYLVWFIFCCKTRWLQWLGMLLCSVYLSGCAENYSPTLALALGLVGMYLLYKQNDWRFWKDEKHLLLLVSCIVIGIGFLFMVFAPGNEVRMAAENKSMSIFENFNLLSFLTKTAKASIVVLLRLLSRGWYFVCALFVFVIIGTRVEGEMPKLVWPKVFISFILSISVIVISVAATVIGIGWYATMRANCFMVFVLMAWESYIGLLLGHQIKERKTAICVAAVVVSVAISVTAISYTVIEYPIVRKYHQEVVAVHRQMQEKVAERCTETVFVQPIDIPCRQSSYGYLRNVLQVMFHKSKRYYECYFPYEPFVLESNSQDWRNQFYKQWLYAQFDIVCVDEEAD